MSPQLVLTIIGTINVFMGIGIYIGAESIVTGGGFSEHLALICMKQWVQH